MSPLFNDIIRYDKESLNHVIIKEKCGIEVLGMTPGFIYNHDGSYGVSKLCCLELKKRLRENNCSGYARFNKLEVVKMLIKI
tara:strand:+ start:131 stop:376 length:246 start_codon:yes stop_codon:yes gene_type:complete